MAPPHARSSCSQLESRKNSPQPARTLCCPAAWALRHLCTPAAGLHVFDNIEQFRSPTAAHACRASAPRRLSPYASRPRAYSARRTMPRSPWRCGSRALHPKPCPAPTAAPCTHSRGCLAGMHTARIVCSRLAQHSARTPAPLGTSVALATWAQPRVSLVYSVICTHPCTASAPIAAQINSDDLIFLRTLGTGASSIVKKALLVRQGGALLPRPRYVAVKRISNLNEARPSRHALQRAADRACTATQGVWLATKPHTRAALHSTRHSQHCCGRFGCGARPWRRRAQELRAQMRKDVSILMDATRARAAAAAPMDGLVAFEGAFMDTGSEQASIVLEYMDGGSLEDVLKHVRFLPPSTTAFATVEAKRSVPPGCTVRMRALSVKGSRARVAAARARGGTRARRGARAARPCAAAQGHAHRAPRHQARQHPALARRRRENQRLRHLAAPRQHAGGLRDVEGHAELHVAGAHRGRAVRLRERRVEPAADAAGVRHGRVPLRH